MPRWPATNTRLPASEYSFSAFTTMRPPCYLHLSEAVRFINHDPASGTFHFEIHFDESAKCFSHRAPLLGLNEKQHKASATGAEQLAAKRSRFPRSLIDVVDRDSGDVVGQLALQHPVFVQQFSQLTKVAIRSA